MAKFLAILFLIILLISYPDGKEIAQICLFEKYNETDINSFRMILSSFFCAVAISILTTAIMIGIFLFSSNTISRIIGVSIEEGGAGIVFITMVWPPSLVISLIAFFFVRRTTGDLIGQLMKFLL